MAISGRSARYGHKLLLLLFTHLLLLFFIVINTDNRLYFIYDFYSDNCALADLYSAGGRGLSPPLLDPAGTEGSGVLDLPGGRAGAGYFSLLDPLQPEDLSFRNSFGDILTALPDLPLALGRV